MSKRVFITAYGLQYEPFLQTCLESLLSTTSEPFVDVWISEMSEHSLAFLEIAFPTVHFTKVKSHVESASYAARVSRKLDHWSEWFQTSNDGDHCFLIDADTLVKGNPFPFLDGTSDILFTYKHEHWPLNVGVIGAVSSARTRRFFHSWRHDIDEVLQSSNATEHAVRVAGAVDQYVFLSYLKQGSDAPRTQQHFLSAGPYKVQIDNDQFVFKGVPCSLLNETNSVSYDNEAAILHYKANMRQVIEGDGAFNDARSKESSGDMFGMWETVYQSFGERSVTPFIAGCRSAIAQQELDTVRGVTLENRGVLNSEAALFAATCRRLGIEVIIESGRARAQSTTLISRLLPEAVIHSIESSSDSDAVFGIARLKNHPNVVLHQGDARRVAPRLLAAETRRVALFIDGPKGLQAVRLAQKIIASNAQVLLVGIHDMHAKDTTNRGRPNFARVHFAHAFDMICFTDVPAIIDAYSDLDDGSGHTPGQKGPWDLGSYGPTLGIALVTWRDRKRASRLRGLGAVFAKLGLLMPKRIRRVLVASYRRLSEIRWREVEY